MRLARSEALAGSYEDRFHQTESDRFLLFPGERPETAAVLEEQRLERAIGVIYRPETERVSHYFFADIVRQFDAVLHLDETEALQPLERTSRWEAERRRRFRTGCEEPGRRLDG